MIPETWSSKDNSIDLYRAVDFPLKWVFEKRLIENIKAIDTTILFYRNKWWLFTVETFNEGYPLADDLCIYHSDSLFGNWKPHALNPVLSNERKARPAGKLFFSDGMLIRPSQNCAGEYGKNIVLNRVTKLSETEYEEETVKEIFSPEGYHRI